jgi:tRNA (guanine37-N1)-methyltransferase
LSKKKSLQFHFLTLFPEIFPPVLDSSLFGKACAKGLVSYGLTQIRDFSHDKHRKVDDTPYGGGEGMILKVDVLYDAWRSVVKRKTKGTRTIMLSPQGQLFTQPMAKRLAKMDKLVFVCGHYEGVDERFIDLCVDEEVSIGNYVLTGGELPAMVMADTIARVVPGVVGNERSISEESLEQGLLKYPQYTRPREFMDLKVPEILFSGNHKAIAEWRHLEMRERTARKRPDLK